MSPETPSSPVPPSAPPPPRPKKSRWLLYGCGGFLILALLVVGTVCLTVWWIQRPIKPVVLSAREKAVAQEKLDRLSNGNLSNPPASSGLVTHPGAETQAAAPDANPGPTSDRRYVPGSKVLRLTEREINGLLNANTDLGKSVRLEFAQDAVNAYVAVPIPQDFPVGGGRMFRARGRFRVSLGNGGAPYAILEDITVFGVSLPKAWLGGLKGENLLGDAMGQGARGAVIKGIKNLRVEPGALVLELED